ncbi:MAG: hypothetical protein HQ567_02270 [Candidatus Nealsonbacteria bacterium]|nr:hypothetical protein [Candidatus Nealsonbacteria bacterium]
MNFLPLLLSSILLAAPPATAADEMSPDQRFLAGLRQRGLFSLAERYCIDRLARENLTEQQRAELTIQWARTLAATAVNSPPQSRGAVWQRALAVTENFAEQHPQNPRLLLVRLQGALGLLDRGELARQESQMVADRGEVIEEARKFLAAAVSRLDKLAGEVEIELRRRSLAGRDEPGKLSAYQLASIAKNIQYQHARACRNQAQCYAAESPDRVHALNRAVELLQPLAGLDPRHPLAHKSHVDLIRTRRLLGDLDVARQLLQSLVQQELPAPVMLRARAEQIRLELAAGRLPDAISVIVRPRQDAAAVSAEFDDACLDVYLTAWRAAVDAKDKAGAAQWQQQATRMVRRIDAEHGPYWARRAEMRLAGYVRGAADPGDLQMLTQAAQSSYRSGRLDDALGDYDRARQLAQKQGNADRAFELGYVAAAIEHKRRKHEAAMTRFLGIARAMPQNARAADAHLLGIDHAAEMTKQRPKELLDGYMELLGEHLQHWPSGPTADVVHRRLGRLHAHARRWKDAIDAYRSISVADPAYRETVEALSVCYRAWLDEAVAAGKPVETLATTAADWFESLLKDSRGALPEKWNSMQREAVVAAARLRLNYTTGGDRYSRAEHALQAAIDDSADATPAWRSAAESLLVYSLAGGGRRREADAVLKRLSGGSTEAMLGMLEGLGRLARDEQVTQRRELAQLQLDAIALLPPDRTAWSASQKRTLSLLHVQAQANAARTAKAALEKWRELEKKSRPQSPRWFLAKYRVAEMHCEMGNKQQAKKIITLLELLHPEMGGMRTEFRALLER